MQLIEFHDAFDSVWVNKEQIVSVKFYSEKTIITTVMGRIALEIGGDEFFEQYNGDSE